LFNTTSNLAGSLGNILLTALGQKRMFVYYESINQLETAYFIMFLICGGAYLLTWFVMHLLALRMKQVEI